MTIDVTAETLIQFRDLPKWTKDHLGRRVHPSTLHRWRLRGTRGIRLETLLAGGTRYTSVEALNRFFAATTAAADGESCTAVPDAVNPSSIAKAEKYLASQGIS